jgi:hypothetical protein
LQAEKAGAIRDKKVLGIRQVFSGGGELQDHRSV